ncbi:MAG: ATP synthase F1 subunit epsilon [Candidatus Uhrbacteria bacterium]|nr:ATP synthase F1 subunit epsilon [Candidatus Uhrbacteria bacterium]
MSKISLKIITPERVVFEDSVDSISATTEMGEVTILPNHVPLVSLLRSGEMRLRDNGQESLLAVSTGLIEVRGGNQIIILADSAERSEELDLEKIEEAKKLAEKRVEEARNMNDVAYADALVHLERELARHRVATKKKYRDVGRQS